MVQTFRIYEAVVMHPSWRDSNSADKEAENKFVFESKMTKANLKRKDNRVSERFRPM